MRWNNKEKDGGFIWLPLIAGAVLNGGRRAMKAKAAGEDPWSAGLKGAATGAALGAGAGMAFGGAGAAGAGATGAGGGLTGTSVATGAAEGAGATSAGLGGSSVGSAVGGASTAGAGTVLPTATSAGGNAVIGGTAQGAGTNAGAALSAAGKSAMTPSITQTGGVGGQGYWSSLLNNAQTKGTLTNDIMRQGTSQAVIGGAKDLMTPEQKYTTYGQPIQLGAAPQLYWGQQQGGMIQ